MDNVEEVKKAASAFTTSIVSVYRLSTRKLTLSDLNNELQGLDHLLHFNWRLRKLWHETRDPLCKTASNRVTKTNHRMSRRKVNERCKKKKKKNATVRSHLMLYDLLQNPLWGRVNQRHQPLFHGLSGLKFLPLEKANAIANRPEKHFAAHDLRMQARVEVLCKAVDDSPPEKVRPCDVQKLINSLKLRKSCGIYGIPNECLRLLSIRSPIHLTYPFNHCFRLSHFTSNPPAHNGQIIWENYPKNIPKTCWRK
jgi:hypothetical protein